MFAAPAWWEDRGVLDNNITKDDYAPVLAGQLKNFAHAAWLELGEKLPGGAGEPLDKLIGNLMIEDETTDDYAAVNIGQSKRILKAFYDRLIEIGYASSLPWSNTDPNRDDFAVLNIGQLKELFNFDVAKDSDGDGLPDWWELANGLNPSNPADAQNLPSGQRLTALQRYQFGDGHFSNTPLGSWANHAVDLLPSDEVLYNDPIATTKGSFGVGGDGSGSYTIPVEIPKGTAGLEPEITLTYSSNGGTGIAGLGWSIGGLGAITRGPATKAQDGFVGGVDFDDDDRFYLNGERLVCVGGIYGSDASEYRTEKNQFSKIVFHKPANDVGWWELRTKSGMRMEFGNTRDSSIECLAQGQVPRAIAWAVNRVGDTVGNYYIVTYGVSAPANGVIADYQPSVISYTGNTAAGLVPYNHLVFEYEGRNDVERGYVSGGLVVKGSRLARIVIKHGTDLGSAKELRAYDLAYEESPLTGRSLLQAVQEVTYVHPQSGASTQQLLPATTFEWMNKGAGWEKMTEWEPPALSHADFGDLGKQFVDLNGDGLLDIVWKHHVEVDKPAESGALINTGQGFVESAGYVPPAILTAQTGADTGAQLLDINGDGLVDIVSKGSFDGYKRTVSITRTMEPTRVPVIGYKAYMVKEGVSIKAGTKYGTETGKRTFIWFEPGKDSKTGMFEWKRHSITQKTGPRIKQPWVTKQVIEYPKYKKFTKWQTVNVTRETHTESFEKQAVNNTAGVWLNTGSGWVKKDNYELPVSLAIQGQADLGRRFADLDHDGLPDLVYARKKTDGSMETGAYRNGIATVAGNDNPWQQVSGGAWTLPTYLAVEGSTTDSGRRLMDLNADGLADIIVHSVNEAGDVLENEVWMLTRNGWQAGGAQWKLPKPLIAGPDAEDLGRFFEDVNGDGLVDFVISLESQAAATGAVPGSAQEVYLNTGNGWSADQPAWHLPLHAALLKADKKAEALLRGLQDFDGDGRPEFFSMKAGEKKVFKHMGDDWIEFAAYAFPPDGEFSIANTANAGVRLVDVNGDGLTDLVYGPGTGAKVVWLNKASPELLTKMTNGAGVTMEVNYSRLNEPDDTEAELATGSRAYTKGVGATYPVMDVTGPQYVVLRYVTENGLGGWTATSYLYGGLRQHALHGSLGFAWMKVIDNQRNFTEVMNFRQDYPYVGMASSNQTLAPVNTDGTPGAVLKDTTNTYDSLPLISGTEGGKIHFPYNKSSTTTKRDLNGVFINATTTALEYNNSGDVTDQWVTSDGFQVTTHNEYFADNTADWILGRLKGASTTHHAPGKTDITKKASFAYNATTGLLESETADPEGAWITKNHIYDAFGNISQTTITAKDEAQVRFSKEFFDDRGRFSVRSENALGQQINRAYDQFRAVLTSETGPNGLSTSYQHDAWGTLLRTLGPDGSKAIKLTRAFTSTNMPDVTYYTYEQASGAPPVITYYDKFNRAHLTEKTGFDGATVYQEVSYDEYGQVIASSKPHFQGATISWTTYDYDVLGRQILIGAPDDSETRAVYNGLKTTMYNGLGQKRVQVVDTQGRVATVEDNEGNITSYNYAADGLLEKTTNSSDNTEILVGYNNQRLKATVTDPNAGTSTITYNGFGEVLGQTDAEATSTTFAYDVLGRMVSRTNPEGTTTWVYDAAPGKGIGKPHTVTMTAAGSGLTTYAEAFAYDNLGRPVSVAKSFGGLTYTSSATFDALGRVETSTDAGGFTTCSVYNPLGFLAETRIGTASGQLLWQAITYDAEGRLIQEKQGNGVTTERSFHPERGSLKTQKAWSGEGAGTVVLQDHEYQFDSVGNVEWRKAVTTTGAKREDFAYDSMNRLKSASVLSGAGQLFTYDHNGNIKTKAGVGTYTYGENGAGPHAVTSLVDAQGGLRDYTYDANGRLLSESRKYGAGDRVQYRQINYASFGQPTHITHNFSPKLTTDTGYGLTPGSIITTIDFTYDAGNNRLTQSKVKGTRTTATKYLGAFELVEVWDSITPSALPLESEERHYFGNGCYTVKREGMDPVPVAQTFRYHLRDHLGSLDVVTDETGQVAQAEGAPSGTTDRQSFDAFGQRRDPATWGPDPQTGGVKIGNKNKQGYTGHEQLDDVCLVHMNGRLYDPELGRFCSADPFVQEPDNSQNFNRYTYVLNNPLSYTDPSGYFFGAVFGAIVAIISAVVSAVVAVVAVVIKAVAAIVTYIAKFAFKAVSYAIKGIGKSISMFISAGKSGANFVLSHISWGGVIKGAGLNAAYRGITTAYYGGSFSDILKSAARGAAVGAVSAVTGAMLHGFGALAANAVGPAGGALLHTAAHGVVGGAFSEANGGTFKDGFISGAVGNAVDVVFQGPQSAAGRITGLKGVALRTAVSSIAGGTGAAIAGGKFASGAWTSAFFHFFNSEVKKLAVFSTVDAAARAALEEIFPKTRKENVEYGGWIRRLSSGQYTYDAAVTDNNPLAFTLPNPPPKEAAGWYHTHGKTSEWDRSGEEFSNEDLDISDYWRLPGYLATPRGAFLKYAPSTMKTSFPTKRDLSRIYVYDPTNDKFWPGIKGQPGGAKVFYP